MKRAETLREIQTVMKPEPLSGEGLTSFYVSADPARALSLPAQELFEHIHEAPKPLRVLFASHSGAGKSTEINRLMVETAADFWFVRLDTQQVLDLLTLTHIDLLVALAEALYNEGKRAHLIDDRALIEPVQKWLSEIVVESKIARREDLDIEAGGGLDGLLTQVLGLFAKLRSAFSLSAETARVVRQKIDPKISELIQHCNKIIDALNKKLATRHPAQQLMVIIEDTDKLDVERAPAIFVNYRSVLTSLKANIIYTVPIHLIHSRHFKELDAHFELFRLPMIKTCQQDGKRFEPGWEILRDIVSQRMTEDLIEPEALALAIDKTGGVLRDLLRVLVAASSLARRQGETRITRAALAYSLAELKGLYRNSVRGEGGISTEQLYDKMKEVAQSRMGRVPPDDVLQFLLYTQAVIEYNGEGWYDLHPLMRDTLREMGYLPGGDI